MNNSKKRICIILPGKLPIPNIKGGAIETLMTSLLEQNEIYNKVHFIVISPWAEGVEKAAAKYKNSDFHYIKIRKGLWKKGINFINYVIATNTGNIDFLKSPLHYDIENVLKQVDADEVVVEHGVYKHFEFLKKYYDREHIFLHLHGAGPVPDRNTQKTFGHVITVSEFIKKIYIDGFNGYNTQFHVCLNGINDTDFKKQITPNERKEIRKSFGVLPEDLLVIYCGRLVHEKGVKELVRAIINTKNKHIKLMVIGSSNFQDAKKTDYVKTLESIIESYKDQIFFTGYMTNNQLYKYYQSADIQVVCSICEEAAGLVCIEGMISGLPQIVTNSGGIIEYVNTSTCIVVDKGNALHNEKDSINLSRQLTEQLNYLYLHRDALVRMCTNATDTAQEFTSNKFYERFMSIFK